MLATAAATFGPEYPLSKQVIDLAEGNKCFIVGTLYKTQKLKPSVLDAFKELSAISAPVEPLSDFTAEDDTLVLEDETGRVMLSAAAAAAALREEEAGSSSSSSSSSS